MFAWRRICTALTIGAATACLASARASDTRRPNVLLVMTDDQGYGDLRFHGNAKIDTPVLDRLAGESARFDRFFVCPLCTPTRASLLSGRYYLRTGVASVTRGLETMRSEEVTIAEVLKGGGYATGCFGKWHLGEHYPNHPNGQGFDEFFGMPTGHWDNGWSATPAPLSATFGRFPAPCARSDGAWSTTGRAGSFSTWPPTRARPKTWPPQTRRWSSV